MASLKFPLCKREFQPKYRGVEFKRADAPILTPSMRIALHDLALDALYVVYPGERRYRLGDRVEAVPLLALLPPPPQAVRKQPMERQASPREAGIHH